MPVSSAESSTVTATADTVSPVGGVAIKPEMFDVVALKLPPTVNRQRTLTSPAVILQVSPEVTG